MMSKVMISRAGYSIFFVRGRRLRRATRMKNAWTVPSIKSREMNKFERISHERKTKSTEKDDDDFQINNP